LRLAQRQRHMQIIQVGAQRFHCPFATSSPPLKNLRALCVSFVANNVFHSWAIHQSSPPLPPPYLSSPSSPPPPLTPLPPLPPPPLRRPPASRRVCSTCGRSSRPRARTLTWPRRRRAAAAGAPGKAARAGRPGAASQLPEETSRFPVETAPCCRGNQGRSLLQG
jgi:hypothetical protein